VNLPLIDITGVPRLCTKLRFEQEMFVFEVNSRPYCYYNYLSDGDGIRRRHTIKKNYIDNIIYYFYNNNNDKRVSVGE